MLKFRSLRLPRIRGCRRWLGRSARERAHLSAGSEVRRTARRRGV